MKPRQAFGVAVRIIGLILVLVAILYFFSWFILLVDPDYRPNVSPAWHYLVTGVFAIVVGLYLLRGAPKIARFAYPDEDSDAKTD
jgi:H+/Cl- antiporter ClcA